MAGYTRQDTANNIANGNVIDADDFDAEYNAIEAGFNATTGHAHDGTAGEGAPITKVGPSQDLVISGTAVTPKTTNTLDLGTASVQYKNAWFDGTVDTDALTVSANATVGGTLGVTGILTATNGVTGAVTGNVTGDVTGNVTGNVTGTVSDVSNHDTGDIAEGSNLYFTTQRARDSVSATGSLSYVPATGVMSFTQGNTDTVAEGSTNLYYTTARATTDAKAAISVTDSGGDGSLTYSAGAITYTGPSAAETRAHFSGGTGVSITNGTVAVGQAVGTSDNVTFNNAIISGNLTVSGTTTTVNSNDVNIADATLTLNSDEAGTPSQDAGIVIERGTSTNVSLLWDESEDEWTVGSGTFVAGTFEGALTGNVTGNLTGTIQTAAQPNITSLGTLTTLTVDDITINGSTISDSGDLTLDVGGDISLDADGGNFYLKDNGVTQGRISVVNSVNTPDTVAFYAGTTERFRIKPDETTSLGLFHAQGNISSSGNISAVGTLSSGGNATVLGDMSVNDDIIMTAGASDWKFEVDASNQLNISYGDVNKMQLDTSGGLTATSTHSTATWETGTDTTDSVVSPAKVKAAIDANSPLTTTSGAAPYYGVRAWNGQGQTGNCTISGSTVTFTTPMPHANYAVTVNAGSYGNAFAQNKTVNGFTVQLISSGGNPFSGMGEFIVVC